ncbi:hypothetical protein GCM10007426_05900 [Alloalcanivorax dieselolei]|nr:hypothetical protein GCM10007426_05900 [Alloalcanivorax dieselolei]
MGEVHDFHDAEDQREPDAKQGIGGTEHRAVDEVLEELVQNNLPDSQSPLRGAKGMGVPLQR